VWTGNLEIIRINQETGRIDFLKPNSSTYIKPKVNRKLRQAYFERRSRDYRNILRKMSWVIKLFVDSNFRGVIYSNYDESLSRWVFYLQILLKNGQVIFEGKLKCFFFFHSQDCPSCLRRVSVLNRLPSHFKVVGIIPEEEILFKNRIKRMVSAEFPIKSVKKFKKYTPPFSPGLIGVTEEKNVLFILPVIPGLKDYLSNFIEELSYEQLFIRA
jgi:hypothetical protein